MLGISYRELFLLLGATAALIGLIVQQMHYLGPKDLPLIARTTGRLVGRAIGYVQLSRGQFVSVMQQSQACQVHKELRDAIVQLEAIRHEIRTISFMNPGPMTRRLVDNLDHTSTNNGHSEPEKPDKENRSTSSNSKDYSSTISGSSNMHSEAIAYARLAEPTAVNSGSMESNKVFNELTDESGLFTVFPLSAKSTGLLPDHRDDTKGSDIVLEAIMEAKVANNAEDFFSHGPKIK